MSEKQYFQGGDPREIEGVKFHIKGAEFIETLNKRAKQHLVAADEAETSLKTAAEAMDTAREAAAKAGRPAGSSYAEMYEAAPTRAVAAMAGGPARQRGNTMEDPVEALRQAVVFHRQRAAALSFYAAHLLPDVVYVIGMHDINTYELLGEPGAV